MPMSITEADKLRSSISNAILLFYTEDAKRMDFDWGIIYRVGTKLIRIDIPVKEQANELPTT